MAYKSELKKKLRTVKLVDKKISYELSYDKTKNLKKFNRLEILEYINNNYINDEELKKEDLINDLIAFRSYKEELDLVVENQNDFFSVLSLLLAICAIAYSGGHEYLTDCEAFKIFVILIALTLLIFGTYMNFRENKNSDFNKLKVLNNAIHVLEALKEEIVDENKILETKKFNLEVSDAEKGIDPNIYSVKVRESLEDKSK